MNSTPIDRFDEPKMDKDMEERWLKSSGITTPDFIMQEVTRVNREWIDTIKLMQGALGEGDFIKGWREALSDLLKSREDA